MSQNDHLYSNITVSSTLLCPTKYSVHTYPKVHLFTFHMSTCCRCILLRLQSTWVCLCWKINKQTSRLYFYINKTSLNIFQSENFSDKLKRTESKNRKIRGKLEDQIEEEMEMALSAIQKPTLGKLWPVRLIAAVISLVRNSPTFIKHLMEEIKHRREMRKIEELELEEEDDSGDGKVISPSLISFKNIF